MTYGEGYLILHTNLGPEACPKHPQAELAFDKLACVQICSGKFPALTYYNQGSTVGVQVFKTEPECTVKLYKNGLELKRIKRTIVILCLAMALLRT